MSVTRRQKRLSKNQEKQAAKDIGGTITPGSGSLAHSKGDARLSGEYLIECKYTQADKYILKLDELLKIRGEAYKRGECPLFQVEFKGENKAKYVFIPSQRTISGDIIRMCTRNKSVILDSKLMFERAFKDNNGLPFIEIEFHGTNYEIFKVFGYEWNSYIKKKEEDNDRN